MAAGAVLEGVYICRVSTPLGQLFKKMWGSNAFKYTFIPQLLLTTIKSCSRIEGETLDKLFQVESWQVLYYPDRSGVHIQCIAGPPESTLHLNQGSCSAHS